MMDNTKFPEVVCLLAGLSAFDYERERQLWARELGVRVSFLDSAVEAQRSQLPEVRERRAKAKAYIDNFLRKNREEEWTDPPY